MAETGKPEKVANPVKATRQRCEGENEQVDR